MTFGHTFKEVYNNLPPEIKDNILIMSVINVYATAAQAGYALSPYLPFFYLERAYIEPHNNIWDMVNPPDFIHFFGLNYENLDPTSKFWIELITGITPQGDISPLNLLLLLAMFIPLVDIEAIAAKLGITGLKLTIPGIKIELPLLSKIVDILKDFAEPFIGKLPFSREILVKGWDVLVTGSKLFTLNPKTWYETLKEMPVIGGFISKIPEKFPIVAELVKAVYDGPLSSFGWALGKISQYNPLKYETWKRAAKFGAEVITVYGASTKLDWLTNTGSNALNTVNTAYETVKSRVVGEYQKVKSQGLSTYIKTEVPKYVATIKKTPIVKAIIQHPITQKLVGYGKSAINYGKSAINAIKSGANALYNGVKSIGSAVYNGAQSLGNTIYKGITNIFRW